MNQKSHKLKTYYSNSMAQNTFQNKKRTIDDLCFWIKNTDVYGAENLKSLHIFFNMTNFFRNMPSLRKTKLIIDADFGKA